MPLTHHDLDALYAPPSERILKAVTRRLLPGHLAYLRAATFFCLATGREQGLDASPRGGAPGFVHALDDTTVAFADWPGNNRIESLRNLVEDQRAGMLFLFPGLDIFMRINGRAGVVTDPELLARLAEGGRLPRSAIVVAIDEVLMHCGKALSRARLWEPQARLAGGALPSVGQLLAELELLEGADPAMVDAHYAHAVKTGLY